jgi:hypothetical protein
LVEKLEFTNSEIEEKELLKWIYKEEGNDKIYRA